MLNTTQVKKITFPKYSGIRILMMPYIQGDPNSVPNNIKDKYGEIIETLYANGQKGEIGYLTIDESVVEENKPHRGYRAKYGRALHTEAGRVNTCFGWGTGWGGKYNVILDEDTQVILANNIDNSCAVWDCCHEDTSIDGDIGDQSDLYPYSKAKFLSCGEVVNIGVFTPHESISLRGSPRRQFIRIVSNNIKGREPYFTINPILNKVT